MQHTCVYIVTGILLIVLSACNKTSYQEAMPLPEVVDYNFHVRPILSDRCFTCHGPDANTREAELRLDTADGPYQLTSEGIKRAIIVPGRPHKSNLIQRIHTENPEEVMPPPASNLTLSPYEKAVLERWIEQGAEWQPHWAFIPPEKPDVPDINEARAINAIDSFIVARIEATELQPNQPATPERLLRRLALDLTGLPPSVEDMDDFIADPSEENYLNHVDRLLRKPAYGEHMAATWLDAARYADTQGYQADVETRMWPWRDWVIEAYNSNLSYDQFLTWQLAGDLLPNATQEQIIATAFNRNHRQTNEGGSIEEEFRTEYVADRTQTMGTAFLGLTLECSRCHDHKYDPISQKEYYQLTGFFNNIDESGQTSHFTDAVPVPAYTLTDDSTRAALNQLEKQINRFEDRLKSRLSEIEESLQEWKPTVPGLLSDELPGLIAHFPLNTINGSTVQNAVNPSRPGTLVFDPEVGEGKQGRALWFDGENGIDIPDVGDFERMDPFSISVWVKAEKWRDWSVLVHHTKAALDAGSRGYELAVQEGRLVAGLAHMWPGNAIRIISKDSLKTNEWIHIGMRYDGSSNASGLKLYVNGRPFETEVVRDKLTRNISYERVDVDLTLAYRFRDTGLQDGALDELKVFDRELSGPEFSVLAGESSNLSSNTPLTDNQLADLITLRQDPVSASLRDSLHDLRSRLNDIMMGLPEIMVMEEMEQPRPTYVLNRGQYDDKGDEVKPGTPTALPAFPTAAPPNRLGLAEWMTAPGHPLTARVAVNRIWQQLFGRGLVGTPEDFGSQGMLPSHPDLLDWLAVTFIESGWDQKALIRLIVSSATYRQSSEASETQMKLDPENILLSRGPKNRLSAEMLRDQALAASGLLVRKIGGPGVKPYQPAGLWEEKSGLVYEPDTGEGLYRRSLYTYWKRTSPPPNMITFDATERNQCIVRRQATSTPMQALVLLNDPQFVEAARKLAERMAREAGPAIPDKLSFGFRLLTGRPLSSAENAILTSLYEEELVRYQAAPDNVSTLLQTGGSAFDAALGPAHLAALTQVASAMMNHDESVMKR